MQQESPDIQRRLIFGDIQPNQTIGAVAQGLLEEILISGEECDSSQAVKKGNDIVILYA